MLELKPSSKPIGEYYATLAEFNRLGVSHEMAVRSAFQRLLEFGCKKVGWTFIGEFKYKRPKRNPASVDGGMVDTFKIPRAWWEAKDTHDDLLFEARKKINDDGYPSDNIIFQAPAQAIVYQDGRKVLDEDITKPEALIYTLQALFDYRAETQQDWERAVEDFKPKIPDVARKLVETIEEERKLNQKFVTAFNGFATLCRTAVNPNLADLAVEEMLVQHLLTERIFRKVFHNSEFAERNVIAHEIEQVIMALTSRKFSREEFFKPLDRFYVALERRADTLDDYDQKQTFLNTVYEKFFQGFAVKVADTHGIVYTPQPIVSFIVRSVEEILKKEFGKSLSDKGVHILDPFVGTGNFIVRVMREIKKTALKHKFQHELHCNEVLLLPYYVAAMNIEHEYYEHTGEYLPFDGICLVDTFELAEEQQGNLFSAENTERVNQLKKTPLFVILGNPPYNVGQLNENDNNKNRKYKMMDKRVAETYAKDSKATNKNALSDPYVKAIRWASDKIRENGEGVVAFVTNNGFIDAISCGGMRQHLENDFSRIYIVDLKGDARNSGEQRRREGGNVFDDQIRVGVSITFFIRKREEEKAPAEIFICSIDDYVKSSAKKSFLETTGDYSKVDWKKLNPNENHTWRTEGLQSGFEDLLPLGTKEAKGGGTEISIFINFSRGAETTRDSWAYNFSQIALSSNMTRMVEVYNEHVFKWSRLPLSKAKDIDNFVTNDETKISWSSSLKKHLENKISAEFKPMNTRNSLYRPFARMFVYFDPMFTHRRGQFPHFFPTPATESENRVICVSGVGSSKPFHTLMTSMIPCLDMLEKTQCFPFYAYDEDGTNRRENISDWALEKFRAAYTHFLPLPEGESAEGGRGWESKRKVQTPSPLARRKERSQTPPARRRATSPWQGEEKEKHGEISKPDVFHYVYGLLHSPEYREKYSANLRLELPRIPMVKSAENFWAFVTAGERLADLHVNYENQPEYKLEFIETPGERLSWRVDKMRLSKDKTGVVYNGFLTLGGVPPQAFEYKLGTRSALEWVIERYQVTEDKRSGIVNDPNRDDDPEYIVKLIRKVITVSMETVKIVESLPGM